MENHPDAYPVHPHIHLNGISSLPEGRGAFWNWGPNYTADPIVLTTEDRPQVLLIRRQDNNMLALPGGFVDETDGLNTETAALRELQEETSLVLNAEGTLVFEGIVEDPRTTKNAWPETSAYLFEVASPAQVLAADDAKSADWYYVDELDANELYGSHAALIQMAIEIQRSRKSKK